MIKEQYDFNFYCNDCHKHFEDFEKTDSKNNLFYCPFYDSTNTCAATPNINEEDEEFFYE